MSAAGTVASGRYRIVRLLGRGGLGEVYLAHDLTLTRDVAIKFVAPEKLADADAKGRLLREARAAASLDHPGICTVYETGESEDGRSYIVMQYVEGETLAKVLARGALPIRDALTLCTQVAEALGAAHRRGVVHRDFKPGNIMVTPSGHPKLVDFGIAKIVAPQPPGTDAPTTTVATEAPSLIGSGTPAYMSPEQIQQRPIDGRSDLFCLGLVLFECLTGRRAFGGRTAVETMSNILHVAAPESFEPAAGADGRPRRVVPAAAREGSRGSFPVGGRSRRGNQAGASRHVAHTGPPAGRCDDGHRCPAGRGLADARAPVAAADCAHGWGAPARGAGRRRLVVASEPGAAAGATGSRGVVSARDRGDPRRRLSDGAQGARAGGDHLSAARAGVCPPRGGGRGAGRSPCRSRAPAACLQPRAGRHAAAGNGAAAFAGASGAGPAGPRRLDSFTISSSSG